MATSACRAAPSSRCCRASPAPSPGSWRRARSSDPKDRLTTILIAPLMTCSARLPVYAVIIAAFIPARNVRPGHRPAGAGAVRALRRRDRRRAGRGARAAPHGGAAAAAACFIMELPKYQLPRVTRPRASACGSAPGSSCKRAGTIILVTTVILWVLAQLPAGRAGRRTSPKSRSPGKIADGVARRRRADRLQPRHRLALIPAMAAREVAVAALGTVYSLDAADEAEAADAGRAASRAAGACHRARLPRLVRVRAAVHLDHRRHPARDQRVEMAALHGRLPVRAGLSRGRRDLLDRGRLRARLGACPSRYAA